MNRKEAIQMIAVLSGGLISSSVLFAGCSDNIQAGTGTRFTEDERKVVADMVDAIIPRTDVPGGVDVDVPSFVIMMMQDCYSSKDQESFHEGLSNFDQICEERYGSHFIKLQSKKQVEMVKYLDSNVLGKGSKVKKLNNNTSSFYRNLKGLTILGYYSSKPGATEALRYVKVPGHYDGCIPYHEGDKEWAV